MKTRHIPKMAQLWLAAILVSALLPCLAFAETKVTLDEQLIKAADAGDLILVRSLLDKGANVNAIDYNLRTAVMHAAKKGQADLVKLFLAKGADPNLGDYQGETALRYVFASGRKSEPSLSQLARGKADCNIVPYRPMRQVESLDGGYEAVARLLLEHGASPNTWLHDGQTVLMWSVINHKIDLLELLLAKGADVNANNNGASPILWAAVAGQPDVVAMLKRRGAKLTLQIAAMMGDKEEVLRLLKSGADVNARDACGRTALMEAAWGGGSRNRKSAIGQRC